MRLSELKPKQGNVDVVVHIIEVSPAHEFSKFGKTGRVANATVKDDSGQMVMSLWNEQIDMIKNGQTIHVMNGYVNEWQGEMQLTTGRNGTIEITDSGKNISDNNFNNPTSKKNETDKTEEEMLDFEEEKFEEEE